MVADLQICRWRVPFALIGSITYYLTSYFFQNIEQPKTIGCISFKVDLLTHFVHLHELHTNCEGLKQLWLKQVFDWFNRKDAKADKETLHYCSVSINPSPDNLKEGCL